MRQALVVSELDASCEESWTRYVAAHPGGTFFHTLAWRDAVTEAFGHRSSYLIARRGDEPAGVFPLVRVSSRLAGTLLVSVPYAVYGGALCDDAETADALLARARSLAERIDAQWVDIRSADAQWDDLPVLRRYVTFRKTLPDDAARVLSDMPRKARAAARTARERHGLQADFSDEHLAAVWSLYTRNMRRLASPNYPQRFFRELLDRTVDAGDPAWTPDDPRPAHLVQLVTWKDKPIAGLLSFIYCGVLMPYFAGCDDRYEKFHPNNFLYLAVMEKGVELGCREFDFGRTRIDNAGSFNFKRFQGFEPTPLQYQYYVPANGRAPDLHPDNPRLAMARRMWPRLPLAVTRPLGAWLAKSIPG